MSKPGKAIFAQFPKTRPSLPPDFEKIYVSQYKSNRDGHSLAAALSQRMESWLHRQVAKDVARRPKHEKTTLELGAGTLNHLRHEPKAGPYDIVEPFSQLYENSPLLGRVRHVYSDFSEVPNDNRYNRIVSIAALEHICNLPEVVAGCGLLLAPRGSLRAALPNEGSFVWTLGWKLTTGLEFRIKHGLDYGVLMKHEHVNTANEIESVLEYFFEDLQCSLFGLTKTLSVYRFYACRNPRLDRCREFAPRSS